PGRNPEPDVLARTQLARPLRPPQLHWVSARRRGRPADPGRSATAAGRDAAGVADAEARDGEREATGVAAYPDRAVVGFVEVDQAGEVECVQHRPAVRGEVAAAQGAAGCRGVLGDL